MPLGLLPIFTGTQPTTVKGSTFFVITEPAVTTAPSPTLTPGNIVTLRLIHKPTARQLKQKKSNDHSKRKRRNNYRYHMREERPSKKSHFRQH